MLFKGFPSPEEAKNLMKVDIEALYTDIVQDNENLNQFHLEGLGANVYQPSTINKKTQLSKVMLEFNQYCYILCFKVYQVLKEICRNNAHNQEYMFKFIMMFEAQIGQGTFVCETLRNCFSKNNFILQQLDTVTGNLNRGSAQAAQTSRMYAKDQVIQYSQEVTITEFQKPAPESAKELSFIRMVMNKLKQYERCEKSDIIDFLASCCRIGDTAIYLNQEAIFQTLQNDEQIRKTALMDIQTTSGGEFVIEIRDSDNQFKHKSLLQFFQEGEANCFYQLNLKYLRSQLSLFSNLCLNRNYQPIKQFGEVFPLQILEKYIVDNKSGIDDEVQACFLKLVLNIYIDKDPRVYLNRPNLVRMIKSDKLLNRIEDHNMTSMIRRAPQSSQKTAKQQFQIKSKPEELFDEDEDFKFKDTLESELSILKGLKKYMLNYLENLSQLCMNCQGYKIYNVLTFQIVKILKIMLQFGIFTTEQADDQENEAVDQKQISRIEKFMEFNKKKSQKSQPRQQPLSNEQLLQLQEPEGGARLKGAPKKEKGTSEEQAKKQRDDNDLDRLVQYLAIILEYDEQYMSALKKMDIKWRSSSSHVRKEQHLLGGVTKLMMSGINQLTTGVKSFFTVSEQSHERNKVKGAGLYQQDFEAQVTNQPFFQKSQGLKKILAKYTNKTYTLKDDSEFVNYEMEIKKQICSLFSFLLDVKQDYYIDSILQYFNLDFINIKETSQIDLELELVKLLPEEFQQIGGGDADADGPPAAKTAAAFPGGLGAGGQTGIKNFDDILGYPFIECLLVSFNFAQNEELESEIVRLLERCVSQKKELIQNIMNLEILFSQEAQHFYALFHSWILKLKNQVTYSQGNLSLDNTNPDSIEDQILRILWKIEAALSKDYPDDLYAPARRPTDRPNDASTHPPAVSRAAALLLRPQSLTRFAPLTGQGQAQDKAADNRPQGGPQDHSGADR